MSLTDDPAGVTDPVLRTPNPTCDFDDCSEPATCTVRTVLGPKPFCNRHGNYVAMIEREWDEAEADYLEQR